METLLAVAAEARTYRNLSYLLLAVPLGLSYFLVLATGLALGALTAVGLPILPAVATSSRRLVAFERRLAAMLLGERIPPAGADDVPMPGIWAAVKAAPRDGAAPRGVRRGPGDPVTFRGLAYLVAKLPLGLASVATVAAAFGLAAGLLLAPVTYRFDAVALRLGPARIDSFEEAVVCFLIAPLAVLAAMHVSNALAVASGRFARLMLASEGRP